VRGVTLGNLPIRRKVNLVTILVSTSVLTLSVVLFLAYDLVNYREQLSRDLAAQAAILADNCTAAIAAGDRDSATRTLAALKAKPEVARAVLYDIDGHVFAQFTGNTPSKASRGADTMWLPSSVIEGHHGMSLEGRQLGRVYITSDLRDWYARAWQSLGAAGSLLVVAALLAYLLSDRLHRLVTGPIAQLRESMQVVSADKDFAVRVERTTGDEVGELIDRFNGMLEEIQRRDAALQSANETLEQRVAERSAALEQRANALIRSEEQLRHQTEMLQSVLHGMGDGVIVAGDDGKVSLFNTTAEEIFHLDQRVDSTLDFEHGQRFLLPDMLTPYAADELPTSRAIRGESVDSAELYLPSAAGRAAVWLSANARPLHDASGRSRSAVVVFRDITEQKRVEAALVRTRDAAEAASRAKSAFLANMSHELRTPLNAIIGYSELLEESAGDNGHDDYVTDLRKVQSAGRHLLALINDVLDLSKIEAGRMEISVEEFDVVEVLQDLLGTLRPLTSDRHNTLSLQADPAIGSIRSDLTKVRQVLFNLLSNANKFTENGTVVLGARRESQGGINWIEFTVQDTGIGIAPGVAEHLFQDFRQADASTTRKYGGTGLGLAICRRFCQMLEGSITLASAPGKGSTFTVRLPAEARFVGKTSTIGAVQPRVEETAGELREVLVIDDDPQARQLIARHLQREGFTPVLASSGPEGLALARQRRPLAITLDVIMPDMDGWAVLSELQSDRALADVPVIMLTILGDSQMGYALGASAYLQKPIEAARLTTALRAIGAPRDRSGRVLVVDDDEATRLLLRRHLQNNNWTVSTACNGRVALECLAQERPDIILLDLMMPEMDGFQFLEHLRTDEANCAIPVVVISAKEMDDEERAQLNGHVSRVIDKRGQTSSALLPEVTRLVRAAARPATAA
jgi:signal transduction histidine kinase/DNA-binding response OmpR family regulator/HAMP domain-containing protein